MLPVLPILPGPTLGYFSYANSSGSLGKVHSSSAVISSQTQRKGHMPMGESVFFTSTTLEAAAACSSFVPSFGSSFTSTVRVTSWSQMSYFNLHKPYYRMRPLYQDIWVYRLYQYTLYISYTEYVQRKHEMNDITDTTKIKTSLFVFPILFF